MGNAIIRNLGVTALAALAGAAILVSCRRDFDSPYMPGSPGYAGDEWTADKDGNGVADSIEFYSPICNLAPKNCLENAKVISRISGQQNSLIARNVLLWIGDSAQDPSLEWIPAEASLRGYLLSSSDTAKVKIRDGRLLPVGPGSAQISVSVPGAGFLSTSFIAKVVSGGIRVEMVAAKDISLMVGRDTSALLTWSPPDADFQDYSLVSDQPLVARIVGQTIRGVFPGKANITLVTLDGSHKTAFTVSVSDGPRIVYTDSLKAETMYLIKGGKPASPVLHWSPANVTDKLYKLDPVEHGIVSLTDDSLQVVPKEAGTTMVVAKALDGSGKATEFTVIVAAEAVPVTGISAKPMNLVKGSDPVAPLLIWSPSDATNRGYRLSSGNPDVAVPASGLILPVEMGASTFTVTTNEGGFQAEFIVNVGRPDTAVHVDSVKAQDFSMATHSSRRPLLSWFPANAGNQAYLLNSDDTTVVRPAGENLVAIKVGTANVELTAQDGGRTAHFKVTVYAPEIPVTQIGADSMSLTVLQEASPTVDWAPSNATNLTYSLVSQDTNIVTIRGGTRVYAKAVGGAKVTIKSDDGPTGAFQVIVNASAVKLTGLTATSFTMNVGDAPRDAIVGFIPSGATNRAVTLKSPSGSGIISINAQNKVVAVAPGKAPLTIVSNENAGIAVTCTVTVAALVKSIIAKDDTLRLGQPDKDVSPLLTWDPPNATDKSFSLKSNDTNVVKPIGPRSYKIVGGGRTTVVVMALDGSGIADTFNVWVKIPVTALTAKDMTLKLTVDPVTVYNTDLTAGFTPANATDKTWILQFASPSRHGEPVRHFGGQSRRQGYLPRHHHPAGHRDRRQRQSGHEGGGSRSGRSRNGPAGQRRRQGILPHRLHPRRGHRGLEQDPRGRRRHGHIRRSQQL
jgi:uncharacterized protein YjdB